MKKMTVLYNDGAVSNFKSYKKIKDAEDVLAILIPLDAGMGHIVIKYAPLMKEFARAKIKFQIACENIHEDADYNIQLIYQPLEVEITDIIEFYNYMHTVDKLELTNNFTNQYFASDRYLPYHTFIILEYLYIEIFDKDDNLIYDKEYDQSKRKIITKTEDSYYIFRLFKDVFPQCTDFWNIAGDYIVIEDGRWYVPSKKQFNDNTSLIGRYLIETDTILFLPPEIRNMVNQLDNFTGVCSIIEYLQDDFITEAIKNKKYKSYDDALYDEIEDRISLYDEFNIMDFRFNTGIGEDGYDHIYRSLELLLFFPYIYQNILFIYEGLYAEEKNSDRELDVLTEVCVYYKQCDMNIDSIGDADLQIMMNRHTILSLEDILTLIYKDFYRIGDD